MNLIQLLIKFHILKPQAVYEKHNMSEMLHLDHFMLFSLFALAFYGLIILYSAEAQDLYMVGHQILRLFIAFILMVLVARISPQKIALWTPYLYLLGMVLLIAVMIIGDIGKGAQRWLDLGVLRFQPSEILKLVIPMTVAWYLHSRPLPPRLYDVLICLLIILIPTALTAIQPDLGTAIILLAAGCSVLFLAGLSWRIILTALGLVCSLLPVMWVLLHDYQRQRILTFLDPERDPLGAGYHIIQSKIAIGSGGLFGKGWLMGSQAHLNYLPEHATDFIFAVCSEEFGLLGCIVLIIIYGLIIARGLQISIQAQDTFTRLLAGSISITFFLSVFINVGMVTGILPVVGLPLPLVSYGGTAMVINLVNFGILMSIHSHRRLVGN